MSDGRWIECLMCGLEDPSALVRHPLWPVFVCEDGEQCYEDCVRAKAALLGRLSAKKSRN